MRICYACVYISAADTQILILLMMKWIEVDLTEFTDSPVLTYYYLHFDSTFQDTQSALQ